MRALFFTQPGPAAEVLEFGAADAPAPRDGEYLVAPALRPIQPADLAFIAGRYRVQPQFPQVAGLEAAGTIIEAPTGGDLTVGTRVAFRWPGSWAERIAVPRARLIAVPDDIADEDACQMALNPQTAWGLLATANAAAGEALLLTAATSTVARLVAQIARARGIRTIGIVRETGDPKGSLCDVTLAAGDGIADRVRAAADGHAVSGLIDSVGGPLLAQLLPALSPGATVIAYGVMDMAPAPVTNAQLIYSNLTWIGFGIDRWLAGLSAEAEQAMMADLWGMLRVRTIDLPVAGRFALADFAGALAANATSGRAGKLLLGDG